MGHGPGADRPRGGFVHGGRRGYDGAVRSVVVVVTVMLAGCGSPVETSSAGSTGAGTIGGGSSTGTSTGAPTTGDATSTSAGSSTGDATTGEAPGCNGHAALCERRYDEVVYPTTHNSFSARDAGFTVFNANHVRPLADQLQAGVRGLLLDVVIDDGETALCHGPCSFGRLPHIDVLGEIADFLAANPREVVTIIYQDDAPVADIAADYAALGLESRVYAHAGGPFPTLAEMIAEGTRLVVTAESGGPPPAWFHHVWDLAWDTPYSYKSVDEFSCGLNRGDQQNPLFLLNHWINSDLDLPSQDGAEQVNVYDVLHGRAVECMQAAGDLPNFVAVDFWEEGDLFAVVDALNGV